ncbi:MAG: hypothetical protein V1866_01290 [archaeon]
MRIPKRYGDYKVERCPFCRKQATGQNSEGVPVCYEHKNSKLPELKCICGSYLEMRKGKFGVFFTCIKCGNINRNKAFEINDIGAMQSAAPAAPTKSGSKQEEISGTNPSPAKKKQEPREIIVRADDPYFCR